MLNPSLGAVKRIVSTAYSDRTKWQCFDWSRKPGAALTTKTKKHPKPMPQSKPVGDSRLRLIPSVDQLLRTPTAGELTETLGVKKVTVLARLCYS